MQREIATQTISEQMRLEFVDTEGLSTPLDAEFEFNPADPYAVSILFTDEPTPVRWTFARDLLIEGFYEPTGDGDVHVWPCLNTEGAAVVVLELSSPSGEVLVQVGSRALAAFIQQMVTLVPQGAEEGLVDLDAALEQLLSA
jgi:hypothetical protein